MKEDTNPKISKANPILNSNSDSEWSTLTSWILLYLLTDNRVRVFFISFMALNRTWVQPLGNWIIGPLLTWTWVEEIKSIVFLYLQCKQSFWSQTHVCQIQTGLSCKNVSQAQTILATNYISFVKSLHLTRPQWLDLTYINVRMRVLYIVFWKS